MTELIRDPIMPSIPESFGGDQRKWAENLLDFLKKVIHRTYDNVTDNQDDFTDHSARHENGGDDEIDVGGLSGELADDQPVKASDAVTKLFCRIKTGTYTGDGAISHAITGIGFAPKYVRIWPHPTAEGAVEVIEKLDQTWGDLGFLESSGGANQHYMFDNRLNSLDADGFTVDDDGADAHPNKNGQVYDYLALG